MAQVGKPLLPWQREILRGAMGVRRDGKWSAYEVAIWLARQNGKGVITEAQELFGAFMLREKKIVHSAHLFDTSREAFNRTVDIIEGSDWLRSRTEKIVRGKGSEAIHLTRAAGGSAIEFKARTLHGARGLSGERITLDEAYGLTTGHYQAISPILATMPNPQITYTSSPPDDKTGMMPDDALAPSIRQRGLDGSDPSLASFEWSPPEEYDPADVDVWYSCNPSLGYLIDEEYLHRQWRVFQGSQRPAAFSTEHLGLWPDSAGAQWAVIPKADWLAAEDPDSAAEDPVAFAVTISTDRQWCTIAAAGARKDGLAHVTIVDRREGTGWVIPRLTELWNKWNPCAVVIDKGSPAGSLALEAEQAGIDLLPIQTREVANAAGAFYDGIAGRPSVDPVSGVMGEDPRVIRHRGQTELNTAVAGAVKRPLSTAFAWDQLAAAVDLSPLIGVSNALWGFRASASGFNGGMFTA
jgi:phage terminase large subunit-like protein